MKKLLIALALLWCAPALAQNTQCPTRPASDNTNACASTAFVQSQFPLSVANGGTGDAGTAWTVFTPSPVCGNATITTNTARSKTIGKTTFIDSDMSITNVGTTCNGANFLWTLPNTSNNVIALAGRNATTGRMITCSIPAASATATCSLYDNSQPWATNDRLVLGGVYENQ